MAFYRSIVLNMACILSYSRDQTNIHMWRPSHITTALKYCLTAPRVKLDYKILIFFVKLNFSIS